MNCLSSPKRVLFFDVETTGLFPAKSDKADIEIHMLHKYPYILQLSFIVFNVLDRTIESHGNYYIKPPDHVVVEPKITEITGITRALCDERGIFIEDALIELYNHYSMCDTIVAHNLTFDSKMIKVEQLRNNILLYEMCPDVLTMFNPIFDDLAGRETFCTMRASVNMCKIAVPRKYGTGTYVKWPTLAELYQHLFSETPKNMHNSIVDTLVGLRCYLKVRCGIEMAGSEFDERMRGYLLE